MTNGSRAADGAAVMARAVELVEAGESFTMATVVWRQAPSSGQHGSRAIVTAQGELFGWIGGACAERQPVEVNGGLVDGACSTPLWPTLLAARRPLPGAAPPTASE